MTRLALERLTDRERRQPVCDPLYSNITILSWALVQHCLGAERAWGTRNTGRAVEVSFQMDTTLHTVRWFDLTMKKVELRKVKSDGHVCPDPNTEAWTPAASLSPKPCASIRLQSVLPL